MEQVIKIDPASGITAEEAIRLNTIKHQITTTTENFLTDIGAHFKEAQDILSKRGYGQFQKFVEECGYSIDTVQRFINRYNLITANGGKREYLETLPTRVLAAAGAKNAPKELTQAVVAGEVSTMKEVEEWKSKYRNQMQRTMELSNSLSERDQVINELNKKLSEKTHDRIEVKVKDEEAIEEAIEEVTKEYQSELEVKIEQLRQTNTLLEDKENAIAALSEQQQKFQNQIAQLTGELKRLEPLKAKAEEIEKIKKQLDKRQEELRQVNLDMDVYKAIREAKEHLHQYVFSLATIVRAPEVIADNIKAEIKNIHEQMRNFIVATTEKFKINE